MKSAQDPLHSEQVDTKEQEQGESTQQSSSRGDHSEQVATKEQEQGELTTIKGVMVTGATTPIGCQLVYRLLDDPRIENVLAVGAEPPGTTALQAYSSRLVYKQVDLTRTRRMRNLLFGPARDLGVEAIIHTAQRRSAGGQGRRVRLLNVESARALMQLSEEHPTIKRFILRSYADVYQIGLDLPVLLNEEHPVDMTPGRSQWVRDRVEADLTVCSRMGLSPLHIVVLRFAECLAKDTGSQLFDFLTSRVCFRPLGFDPMLNVLSICDMVDAVHLALRSEGQGIFNIPGKDTLPLSDVIRNAGRVGVPIPGALLAPLYRFRSATRHTDFRYDQNRLRFHFNCVLDGCRAKRVLGYEPSRGIDWAGLELSD